MEEKLFLSKKLSIAGIISLILMFVFIFAHNTLLVGIFGFFFFVFLIAAWVATVPERGGVMAWLHRRKEEQADYDERVRKKREMESDAYHKRKGEIEAEKRFGRSDW
ncbi:MAG: hypothetical protein M1286_01430 [Candidatus Marsarchaeota archaeon]|nr:hypothetical protein [Candidatus Marsarchaeota archaeon]